MPYVKCISGHTSARSVQLYLERGGRALATDFLNIDAPVSGVRDGLEDHGRIDWWRETDRTRAVGRTLHGLRAAVVGVGRLVLGPVERGHALGLASPVSESCFTRTSLTVTGASLALTEVSAPSMAATPSW